MGDSGVIVHEMSKLVGGGGAGSRELRRAGERMLRGLRRRLIRGWRW
ncbi:MAG: hypothetical protein O8C66_12215 [Candidatus Methanoperedens sp.]|nr:hypothetical protein [Candidatus Methanoperedens sp.]MCZ7371264.1 hypothetical protein [Candidatus Methanoperedens sp.]